MVPRAAKNHLKLQSSCIQLEAKLQKDLWLRDEASNFSTARARAQAPLEFPRAMKCMGQTQLVPMATSSHKSVLCLEVNRHTTAHLQ